MDCVILQVAVAVATTLVVAAVAVATVHLELQVRAAEELEEETPPSLAEMAVAVLFWFVT
jgi:hypothetical protein